MAYGMLPEFTHCPECAKDGRHSVRFAAGIREGASLNIGCLGCGQWFTVVEPPTVWQRFGLARTARRGKTPAKPADLGNARYIIELIPRAPE